MLKSMLAMLPYIIKNPLTAVGMGGIFLLIIVSVLAPWLAPYPQDALGATNIQAQLNPPTFQHLFGTDELGRDVLSRVIYGARISLQVGMLAIGLALLVGVSLGLVAGCSGGGVDEVIMRIADIFLSFPPLLLAMAISVALGPSLQNVMVAIAIAWWPWYARLLRSEATSVRERSFVEAARAIGASRLRISFRHVLPNCLVPIVIQASMDFGAVTLTCASLSFLGLGAQAPTPEWGLMISTGRTYFLTKWWIVTFPGIAIFVAVLAFNLTGDGLREILDPKIQRRGR